ARRCARAGRTQSRIRLSTKVGDDWSRDFHADANRPLRTIDKDCRIAHRQLCATRYQTIIESVPATFTRAFSRLDESVRESLFVFLLSRGLVLVIFIVVGQIKFGTPEV